MTFSELDRFVSKILTCGITVDEGSISLAYVKHEKNMKRIVYISRLTNSLSIEEIEKIGIISSQNNKGVNITGLLVYFENLFFQIIEGNEAQVDKLFLRIGKDPRHRDILRLKTEYDIEQRLFSAWAMKMINLDNNVDELVRPIKVLLQAVMESHTIIEQYTQPTILHSSV